MPKRTITVVGRSISSVGEILRKRILDDGQTVYVLRFYTEHMLDVF